MAKVFRLSNYRNAQSRAAEFIAPQHPYYYCTRCEGEKFILGSAGEVQCASCGALMRNLAVHDER